MSDHFANAVSLETPSIKLEGLPDGMTFEDLHVNDQRMILGAVRQQQIEQLQGEKIALFCMSKVSFYETYEDAVKAQEKMSFLDSQIFLPKGHKKIPSKDNLLVCEIQKVSEQEFDEVEKHKCSHGCDH